MNLMEAAIAAKLGGGAVSSVNGQTGAVVLDADDVGAEPEKLVVTVTESGGVYSADKTRDEIATAYNNGKVPVVKFNDDVYELANTDSADFCFSVYIDGKIKQIDLIYNGSDQWSYTEIAVQPISITCTMTSQTGGTWSGATFAELQAACDIGRPLQATITGIGQMAAFLQPRSSTNVGTSPIFYGNSIIRAVFENDGSFSIITLYTQNTTVTVSGTTPTISPAANTIYNCGELTSLTISNAPATGSYSIVFTSGATATTTTIPATILGLEDFAPEANTLYEINVLDNRAVVGSWVVSA